VVETEGPTTDWPTDEEESINQNGGFLTNGTEKVRLTKNE